MRTVPDTIGKKLFMNREYSNELRLDTAVLIFPFITVIFLTYVLLSLVAAISNSLIGLWPLLAVLLLSPLVTRYALRQSKNPNVTTGRWAFIGTHLLLLTMLFGHNPNTAIGEVMPYFFTLLIIAASMTIAPVAGLIVWGVTWPLVALAVWLNGLSIWSFGNLLTPMLLGLLTAVAMYLSAIDWQLAVESVSVLHRRAQERRDELFAIKEELSATNDRLRSLNEELDQARRVALHERDIRTRFMNNVSHELRTPLNAIVNFAHILKQGGVGDVNSMQADYLGRIEKSGWHLLEVLNDLLDMAQIESGEFKLYLQVSDLRDVCEEAALAVQGLILDNDAVEFRTEYPDEWPLVYVDQVRLKQGLINLLGNAAKYTEKGSITLRVFADEASVYLQVADTGVGIAREYHELIFQEFKQVDETAARKRIGTGLGLPITRHLIERHGGHITLESEPGKGSTFTICLPRHVPGESTAGPMALAACEA